MSKAKLPRKTLRLGSYCTAPAWLLGAAALSTLKCSPLSTDMLAANAACASSSHLKRTNAVALERVPSTLPALICRCLGMCDSVSTGRLRKRTFSIWPYLRSNQTVVCQLSMWRGSLVQATGLHVVSHTRISNAADLLPWDSTSLIQSHES